jgi:hypothetical protein
MLPESCPTEKTNATTITKLFPYILGAGSGDVDPGLGEESAGAEHKDDVEHSVDGIFHYVTQRLRG